MVDQTKRIVRLSGDKFEVIIKMKCINVLVTMIAVMMLSTSSGCLQEKKDDAITPIEPTNQNLNYSSLADSLQNATYSSFLSSDGKYFMQDNAGNTKFHYWWNAHALDMLVDAYVRTKEGKYAQRMKALVSGVKDTNKGTHIIDYYDDMEWLALASLRAYEATQDVEYLNVTKLLWTDIKTGLNGNQGGGIAWRKEQLDYKNTPANAPAIIIACRLYKLESDGQNLELAKSLYSWLKNTLVDPATGLAWDGINRNKDGQIDKWMFTYNQGTLIGAAFELFNVTREQSYLNDAIRAADNVVNDVQFFPGGVMKEEGTGDGGLFKASLVRYLTLLSNSASIGSTRRGKYQSVILFNAKTLADKGIKRPTMLVGPDWTKRPASSTELSSQMSGVMLIEAAASIDK
ncbi:glycoside hydrolase family 76 protein [Chryseosolibacter indicus]|uniref:Glycosyl hydrolase family 76 n=1 Tax=Chryseosolibacter indicus TaxID=2782351 RepID=A0ABS5VKI6_9BACT|nr:glycoside hydrolase family 76 protein [Chryseosolibacter indicus]MBT1701953.1 hypothetical protein [Chryseosolibacter indicus]